MGTVILVIVIVAVLALILLGLSVRIVKQYERGVIYRAKDKDGRISLTLNPPGMDAVTYACACDKFFPVVTPHKTKSGEQLIIAVMAKPCTKK